MEFLEYALSIVRKIGDHREEGIWIGHLGRAYRALGQIERAMKSYEEALSIARELGNRQEVGIQLGHLGTAYRVLGQIERSTSYYEQALAVAREIGDYRMEGSRLGSLGFACYTLGEIKRAIKFYEEALIVARKIGDYRGEGVQLGRLGAAYRILGQTERAIEFYKHSLTIAREIGDHWGQSYCLLKLGKALLDVGEVFEALRCSAESLALDVPRTSYQAALVLGIALLHQHDPTATNAFSDAAARCRAMLDKTADLYEPCYALAAALVGQAVCDLSWARESERAELLVPALAEYRRALENCDAPGVVQGALRDLEMIRAAGIEGLEPVFELLENAEYEPDLPEDLPDILEEVK
jgi:hypothetical protein